MNVRKNTGIQHDDPADSAYRQAYNFGSIVHGRHLKLFVLIVWVAFFIGFALGGLAASVRATRDTKFFWQSLKKPVELTFIGGPTRGLAATAVL